MRCKAFVKASHRKNNKSRDDGHRCTKDAVLDGLCKIHLLRKRRHERQRAVNERLQGGVGFRLDKRQ